MSSGSSARSHWGILFRSNALLLSKSFNKIEYNINKIKVNRKTDFIFMEPGPSEPARPDTGMPVASKIFYLEVSHEAASLSP